MKRLLPTLFKLAVVVPVVALSAPRVLADVVYDNSSTRSTPERFASTGFELGDEIVLDGSARFVTEFIFEYYGLSFSGNEQARLRFYANDGDPGTATGSFQPGTALYDSGVFTLLASEGATLTFPGVNTTVPDSFTWAVEFAGVAPTETAGLALYSPPTVGAVAAADFSGTVRDYAWERSGPVDLNGDPTWTQIQPQDGQPPLSFGARVTAVPEPSTVLLSILGGVFCLAIQRRLRTRG